MKKAVVLLMAGFLGWFGRDIHAQANLRIAISPQTNGVAEVSWPVRSLVPSPGNQLFPAFKVTVSSNLLDWQGEGERIGGPGLANQTARVPLTNLNAHSFVKVESIIDFSGGELILLRLARANFERGTFVGTDFFGADLQEANFRRANLQAADLRSATLDGADLREADLFGSTLSGCTLNGADLENADVSYSDLTDATLDEANFRGADLRFTSLLGTTAAFTAFHDSQTDEFTLMEPETRFVWEIVNGQAAGKSMLNLIMRFADLSEGDLTDVNLAGTDLRGSDLRGANVSGANFLTTLVDFIDWRASTTNENTRFNAKTRLVWEINNSDFSGRDLAGRDLSNSFFVQAMLSGANLANANLTFCVLFQADLSGANLRGARLPDVDANRVNFQNADLTGANLSRADLTDANFLGATLANVNFQGAIFNNTTMADGTIRNF